MTHTECTLTGWRHMVMARSARMGTKTFAVAVLLQRLVMITARPVKMRLATQPGNEDKFILTIKLRILSINLELFTCDEYELV